jgi:hypothetical protein
MVLFALPPTMVAYVLCAPFGSSRLASLTDQLGHHPACSESIRSKRCGEEVASYIFASRLVFDFESMCVGELDAWIHSC